MHLSDEWGRVRALATDFALETGVTSPLVQGCACVCVRVCMCSAVCACVFAVGRCVRVCLRACVLLGVFVRECV